MRPFNKCPVCGGEMVEKEVEKLLRGGVNLAAVNVHAEVCLRCGETVVLKGDRQQLRANPQEACQPAGRGVRPSGAIIPNSCLTVPP